jgi:hypothetical protein
MGIRIFSLGWLCLSLLAVYLLARKLVGIYQLHRKTLPLTIWLYLLSSVVLWYHVQGYVHEVAVIPFYLLAWYFFVAYLHQGNQLRHLLLTGLFILVGVQFDWLPCMQAFTMFVYLLMHARKLQQRCAFAVPALCILAGIAFIAFTYMQWAGTDVFIAHMKSKFLGRTVSGSTNLRIVPHVPHQFNIIIFYGASFGIAACFFAWQICRHGANAIIWMMVWTAMLHHLVFWGFSSEHDHAALKMAFPLAFAVATYLAMLKRRQFAILTSIVLVNLSIFFLLHNYNFRAGMYRNPNYCYELGNIIKRISTDPSALVLLNTEGKYFPQVEWYAGRAYTMANSIDEAKTIMAMDKSHRQGLYIERREDGSFHITRLIK